MKHEARVLRLRVQVEREEVRRYLGYPPGRSGAPLAEERLDALWEEALGELRPRGVVRVVDQNTAAEAGIPDPGPRVGVGLCTVGGALEELATRRNAAAALLDALLLDAIGSAAAEATADALNARLCRWADRLGLHAAARRSPGYGDWETAGQEHLLALLPAAALGVSLTEGMMMRPRKSVSFAVNFVEEPPGARIAPCGRCGLPRCRHRMAAPPGAVWDCG
jgi:hypothetical protein